MTINELHQKIIEAYSPENLNKITLPLLSFYKRKQYSILKKIALQISKSIYIDIDENGKGFSKFMMLYHPDRANFHIQEIDRLLVEKNYDGLLEYSHILLLLHIDEISASIENFEEIDFVPVYEWDFDVNGFSIFRENDTIEEGPVEHSIKIKTSPRLYNFYDAIKVRMFDNTEIEYPSYYLEDFDEFELASSGINDLEGVEFCKHVKILDLSDNYISDLTPLCGLSLIEDLNLADNDILDIDALSNLGSLRIVNLSNNKIDDISPIMNLSRLECVDLRGTMVSNNQVVDLRGLGVTVEL
jgi:Leucine-rich repeat (LRR) protein